MALNNQALLDYIAAHPGAGRDDIRQYVAPDVSPPSADAKSRPGIALRHLLHWKTRPHQR
jgi:hypothetical protein